MVKYFIEQFLFLTVSLKCVNLHVDRIPEPLLVVVRQRRLSLRRRGPRLKSET